MKLLEKEEMEETKKRLEKIEKTSFMAQYHAEEAAKVLAKRTEAAAKIATLEKERVELLPRLQKDLAEKEGKFLQAKRAMEAAFDEFKKSKNELTSASFNFSNAIGRHEQTLIESAPKEIDEAILFFREKLDWLRSPGRISTNRIGAVQNIFTLTVESHTETNSPAVRSALSYCMAAVPVLEEMKLWPELDGARIQAIKDGIPSIDVYTELSGTRPMPKPPSANPRDYLPTDSEMEWSLNKINEKFDKLMKRPRRA